jgi:DNA transformation protein
MMGVSEGFREYVSEQLGQVTAITLRRMFGGVGIYSRGFFFALMDNDTLFFKVDESNRPDYEARGMHQFRPFGDDRQSLGYYEVPAEVLEDTELLRAWVRKSVSVAMSKAAQKRSRPRKLAAKAASRRPSPGNKPVRAVSTGRLGRSRGGGRAGRRGMTR